MRKAILIVTILVLCAFAFGQDKSRHSGRIGAPKAKPKPTPPPNRSIDDLFDPIPADETLFNKMEYSLLDGRLGWRLAVRGQKDSDGIQSSSYYDVDRIRSQTRNKEAWIRTETHKGDTLLSVWLDLSEYDCRSPRVALIEATEHNKEGKVVFRSRPSKREWDRVVPDSIGEQIYGIICRNEKDQERLDMEEADMWFRLGVQARKRKDYKAAVTHFQKAERLFPRNGRVIEEVILAQALAP